MFLMEDEWILINYKIKSIRGYLLEKTISCNCYLMYFVDKRFTNSIHNEGTLFEIYKKNSYNLERKSGWAHS